MNTAQSLVQSQELHAQIQYRLMEELSASERRYRELIERIREVVFKCETDGTIVFLNSAWTQIMGYTMEQSLGCQIVDYVHKEDRKEVLALFTEGPGTKPDKIRSDEQKAEVRFICSNGNPVWLILSIQPGETDGKIGSLYDIDERKQAQHQLQLINEELEERVTKRTSQLAESNTHLAQEMEERKKAQQTLMKAERLAVVGETSGRVAHEVLNPVTSIFSRVEHLIDKSQSFSELVSTTSEIIGDWQKEYQNGSFVDYLIDLTEDGTPYGDEDFDLLGKIQEKIGEFNTKQKEDLQFIRKQLRRVIKIINALRESVIDNRSPVKLDLCIPIEESYEAMEDSFTKRKIQSISDIPDDLPLIMADESEMIQVFTNLFRNAMQSIDEKKQKKGFVKTEVKLCNDLLEIRVSDNGKGIPLKNQGSIFDFDFTTKPKDKGTGLGLGICRRFVRENGGDLNIEESIEGKGTTFLATIPYINEG